MEKVVINACPICTTQGKKTYLEGKAGDENISCAIHGLISVKFFHDIFIDPSWFNSLTQRKAQPEPRSGGL